MPSLKPIDRTTRSQQVREQLERAVLSGEFAPGDRLPSERELTQTFGVSRVSVREALRSLEALGMIRIVQGSGCFVVDPGDNASSLFRQWIALHSVELHDVLQVHEALGGLAAAQAAEIATPETVSELEAICDDFDACLQEPAGPAKLKRLLDLDVRFHDVLTRASGIPLIAQLLHELNECVVDTHISLGIDELPANSAVQHRAIVQAIADGDGPRARAAMQEHVQRVRETLQNVEAGATVPATPPAAAGA